MAPRKKKEKEHKPSPWESNYDQIVKDELEARLELVRYYRENNLNPDINYYDDPVHGPIIKKLHQKTRLGVRAAEALRKPRNLHPNVTKVNHWNMIIQMWMVNQCQNSLKRDIEIK